MRAARAVKVGAAADEQTDPNIRLCSRFHLIAPLPADQLTEALLP
jgi:hypothetical protein